MDSLLTVICRQIYHWLAVSREMDQERKASVIYSVATDGHPVFRFLHQRNDEQANVSFRILHFSAIAWRNQ